MFSDSVFPILNGVSVSVDALVTELRNQGHSVHLYCPRHHGFNDPDPNTYRFRSIATPWNWQYPIVYPPFYRMLLKFRRHQYDVIHTHTPFLLGMVALRWAESHELPIVSTYHTLYDRYAHYMVAFPRRYIRFRIAKHTNFYYNSVNEVITPTEASLKWLRRHSVDTNITVIPTASPGRSMLQRGEVRQSLGIPPDIRVLLYVGRLAQEKNLAVLLEMAALAMRRDPSLRLWLVGDGPYRSECRQIVRDLGIGDRVRFVGAVPREEVGRYYAAADLFVFPSITETQGLVVQEAMTYGLPAVAVSGGGASALIEEDTNGFVARNDPLEFSDLVMRVMEDERIYTRLSEGALKTSRQYGMAEMCQRVVDTYRRAIDGQKQEATPVGAHAWI